MRCATLASCSHRAIGALLGRVLGFRRRFRQRRAQHLGLAAARQVRPDHDPLLRRRARRRAWRSTRAAASPRSDPPWAGPMNRYKARPDHVAQQTRRRPPRRSSPAPARAGSAASPRTGVARVVGQGDARLLPQPVELAPEAQGRGERNRPRLAVAQADGGDGRDHGTPGRGDVGERRRQVTAEDPVDLVGPSHRHKERS